MCKIVRISKMFVKKLIFFVILAFAFRISDQASEHWEALFYENTLVILQRDSETGKVKECSIYQKGVSLDNITLEALEAKKVCFGKLRKLMLECDSLEDTGSPHTISKRSALETIGKSIKNVKEDIEEDIEKIKEKINQEKKKISDMFRKRIAGFSVNSETIRPLPRRAPYLVDRVDNAYHVSPDKEWPIVNLRDRALSVLSTKQNAFPGGNNLVFFGKFEFFSGFRPDYKASRLRQQYNLELLLLSSIIGTLWCGPGADATSFRQLGTAKYIDRCCRIHDNCPMNLMTGETNYNITNTQGNTRSHCSCDSDFFHCLQKTNNEENHYLSEIVGFIFFSIAKLKCISPDGNWTGESSNDAQCKLPEVENLDWPTNWRHLWTAVKFYLGLSL